MGQWQQALVELEKSEDLMPGVEDTLLKIAEASYQAGQYDNAIAMYLHIIDSDSSCQQAYVELGITFYTVGKYDKAVAAYAEALKHGPGTAPIYFAASQALAKEGDTKDAVLALAQARRLDLVITPGAASGR
jgi:tetratricopeptide (TPR) repeat protein